LKQHSFYRQTDTTFGVESIILFKKEVNLLLQVYFYILVDDMDLIIRPRWSLTNL